MWLSGEHLSSYARPGLHPWKENRGEGSITQLEMSAVVSGWTGDPAAALELQGWGDSVSVFVVRQRCQGQPGVIVGDGDRQNEKGALKLRSVNAGVAVFRCGLGQAVVRVTATPRLS